MSKMQSGDLSLYGWEQEFDEWIKNRIDDRDVKAILDYQKNKNGLLAAPTPDHFVPLIYSMALIEDGDEIEHTFDDMLPGFSNRSFVVGLNQ